MNLSGATVLVTGGAKRVGRAVVEELARAGARMAIHHRHSAAEAAELTARLPGAIAIAADLTQADAADQLVTEVVEITGRIDALVNCAADYARSPLTELTDERWESMLRLNVTAPMRLIRAASRVGVRAVVNFVDVAAWQPWPNYLAYSTSKAALLHLTRCLALELAPAVRVNAVAPGTVIFPEDWSAAQRERQLDRVPLHKEGTPEDAARAVRYLLTEDYLTGVCIPVDGGSGLR